MANTCPLQKFFSFEGKCPIKTCQNNTKVTDSGCLALDRKERSDRITDSEILYYKILPEKENFASKSRDVKFASYMRKRYITAAKSNMALFMYVTFCKHRMEPHKRFKVYVKGENEVLDTAINTFPLNQDGLGFEPWMLYYLYNPKFFKFFVSSLDRGQADSINLVNVLGITPRRFTTVVDELKRLK